MGLVSAFTVPVAVAGAANGMEARNFGIIRWES